MQHIITIGAAYSIVQDGKGISALDNLNVDSHPAWSPITVFYVSTSAPDFAVWIDPSIWNMETPSVTCSVPYTLKIPPWLGATRVVDYPLLTVSDGSWTSTITQPPITMTSIEFEHITITANAKDKGEAIRTFFPIPTTTSDKPTETPPRPEKPSPRVSYPGLNKRDCYKNTRGIDRSQAADLINRFCGEMEQQLLNSGQEYANQWSYSPPGQISFYVRLWFGISKNTECRWVGGKSKSARPFDGFDGLNGTSVARRDVTDSSLCARYMDAIVDSCNCGGINGKQGGKINNDCFYMGIHPVNKF